MTPQIENQAYSQQLPMKRWAQVGSSSWIRRGVVLSALVSLAAPVSQAGDTTIADDNIAITSAETLTLRNNGTTTTHVEVDDDLKVTGLLDVYGNAASFGSWGSTAALLINLDDTQTPDLIRFIASTSPAAWSWEVNGATTPVLAMKLTETGLLRLQDVTTTSNYITLDPVLGSLTIYDASGSSYLDRAKIDAMDDMVTAPGGVISGDLTVDGSLAVDGDIQSNGDTVLTESSTGAVGIYGGTATGEGAVANGDAVALGSHSFAWGDDRIITYDDDDNPVYTGITEATRRFSFAYGEGISVKGEFSSAFGRNHTVEKEFSFVAGFGNDAHGPYSVAFGALNSVGGYSVAFGRFNEVYNASLAAGTSNEVGVGPFDLFIYGGFAFGSFNHTGYNHPLAFGKYNESTGDQALAGGYMNVSSGNQAVALGYTTQAVGEQAVALNSLTIASGRSSMAVGYYTKAESYCSIALGYNNVGGGSSGRWSDLDPLLEVGNGTSTSANDSSNALTVLKNGQTTLENRYWASADEDDDGTPDSEADPSFVPSDENSSAGQALVVDGHAKFNGKVTITYIEPQGDISMGMFGQ